VFFGVKEASSYWHNGFYWTKPALFGLVFALELAPMITFIRVRTARSRGTALRYSRSRRTGESTPLRTGW
jgi:uncharacterized membrane protein